MTEAEDRLDRLESLVEQQQETIEAQRERIAELESDGVDDEGLPVSRRDALTAGGLLALFGVGSGQVAADSQGQVGTSNNPLTRLYTDGLNGGVTEDVDLTSLFGDGLTSFGDELGVNVGDGLGFDAGMVRINGDVVAGNALEEGTNSHQVGVESDGIGTDELDLSIAPTWTGTHTWDTAGGANLNVDETGVYYDTSNDETLNVRNAGSGSLTLQEDGIAVVKESRTLGDGHAIQSAPLGDLSENRTVNVDATALSGEYLSAADKNSALSVEIGSGLTDEGSDPKQIRVNGSTVAGNVLSANGSNPYQIDLNIGNGLESNGTGPTNLRVNPEEVAGTGLSEEGSNQLQIDATTINHNNLQNSGQSDAHHPKDHDHTESDVSAVPNAGLGNSSVTVTAGTGLSGGGSASLGGTTTLDIDSGGVDTNEIASGAITSTEIDLPTIAGTNISVDGTELKGETPAMKERDDDGLLEPVDPNDSIDGIDVTTVQVTNLDDTSGNSHLTLNNGGNLGVNQTLDTNGNDITSSSGNITLGSALDTSGNNLTDSIGTVTLGSPLDTNGNGIQSDGSVSVDIDADDSGTSETFTVTKDGGATTLLTVNEGGEVDINSGDLDLNGNNVSDSTGDLTFSPRGRFVISGGLSAGSGNNVNIDSSTGELLDATASSVRYKTNIEPLSTDTSAVLDIEPRSYEYEERGEPSVGFIAEKVDETFPDLVIYDEQGRPDGIKYHRLGVYLLPEIRRNRESVDDLRATAEEREERIDDQRDRIERLESTVERKDDRIDTQADRIDDLEAENDRLRERMAAIEARLDGDASGGRGVTADD